jgi:hypothetical protein
VRKLAPVWPCTRTVTQRKCERRDLKAEHRSRYAYSSKSLDDHDPFQLECAERLLDKVRDVTKYFKRVLLVGGAGTVRHQLDERTALGYLSIHFTLCAGHTFAHLLHHDDKSKQVEHISYLDQSWPMAKRLLFRMFFWAGVAGLRHRGNGPMTSTRPSSTVHA